jgi:DNA helicase MCM8
MARNRGDTLRMHMLEGSRPIAALPATASSTQAPPRRSLTERLKEYQQESTQPLLPHALMRTYLDYARRHVFPVLSPAAAAVLQSFYLRSRQRSRVTDGTPVTARQLESLVRLAEARARVELREEVSAQDAQVRSLP